MNNLLVDGLEADLSKFVYPTMSLSSSRADMERHIFELYLEESNLIRDFTQIYKKWATESKSDDEKQAGPDTDDIIGVSGYPELSRILKNENMVEMLFGCYLIEEIFQKYCCSNYEVIDFWYDEITSVAIANRGIKMYGTCYSKKKT